MHFASLSGLNVDCRLKIYIRVSLLMFGFVCSIHELAGHFYYQPELNSVNNDGSVERCHDAKMLPMCKDISINRLLAIMQKLRDPKTGCPWDQQQSFPTIAPYTVEEAYEVADAIAREDMPDLRDELGDLLFQVVYHAQMAAELNYFDFADVLESICNKMIRRHPHVFNHANSQWKGEEHLKKQWEQMKHQERAEKNGKQVDASSLAGISKGLPSLLRARKLQSKAALVNFDWSTVQPVVEKVREELDELEEAFGQDNPDHIEEELGDLMFSLVNLSRHLKFDADVALQKANTKFERRFRALENSLREANQELAEMSEQALEEHWQKIKTLERK